MKKLIKLSALTIVGAALMIVLFLAADSYLSHGLTATWYVEQQGQSPRKLARTVEHRTTFPNLHRPLSRYVQSWDFEKLGIPQALPRLDVELRGILSVPEGAARYFRAVSQNDVQVSVNEKAHGGSQPLRSGNHDIRVSWKGDFGTPVSLGFEWSTSQKVGWVSVPRTSWSPSSGAGAPRVFLWVATPVLFLAFGLICLMSVLSKVWRPRLLRTVGAVAILGLGITLRLFDYDVMPEFRENGDELFATWNGWQLLTDGTTRGWSLWHGEYRDQVKHEDLPYFEPRPWHIIRPYFEHPPLLHVFVGAAAKLGGAAHFAHAKLKHTRLVPIALAGLSILLLLSIGRRLYPSGPASYLGALLFAVLPMTVLQSRVIKEEAMVVPLSLAGVLFYLRWRDGGEKTRDVLFAGLCMGLCTVAKVTGAFFAVAVVVLVATHRRFGAMWVTIAGGAVGVALLLVYGACIDWDVFWFTTVKQATGRPSHFNLFPRFFDDPLVNHNLVGRGLLLFLWLAYAASVANGRERMAVLTVPPLMYLAAMGISSGNWTFGWYLLPIYPFLCLGAGRFLANLWEEPDFFHGFLFVALALMYPMNFLVESAFAKDPRNWPLLRREVTIFCACGLAPMALAQAFRSAWVVWLARAITALGLCLLVFLSSYFVVRYDRVYETHRNFDRDVYFDR